MSSEQSTAQEAQRQMERVRAEEQRKQEVQRQENLKRLVAARTQQAAQERLAKIDAAAEQITPKQSNQLIGEISRQEGKLNEDIARDLLHTKGYEVLELQQRPHGIDIVARDPQRRLALIEVKTDKANTPFGTLLSKAERKGLQCSDEWVKKTADEMAGDADPRRRALASEIRARPENIRVLGIAVNVLDNRVTLHERLTPDARLWRSLEQYSI